MYADYNSTNKTIDDNNLDEFNKVSNKIFKFISKLLLVLIVFVTLFIILIATKVISLKSNIIPDLVILNQNEIGIKKGNGYQLVSTVLPENASSKQLIYESSDPSIASVNKVTGYIEAHKDGQAVITVKTLINDKKSECIVNVGKSNVLVDSINITNDNINIAVGYSYPLNYKITPSNATEINLSFTSSDPSVAIVDQNGIIKGVKSGNALITAESSNGVKTSTYVTVYKKGIETVVLGETIKTDNYPKSITLKETKLDLKLGSTAQLEAIILPNDANKSITWTSSNDNVVTIENGLIVTKGLGNADIVAKTINNLTAICHVTVGNYNIETKKISIAANYSSLLEGSLKQLFVSFEPNNAVDRSIIWSTSDKSVATVSANGLVTAISSGTAIIKAKTKDGKLASTTQIDVLGNTNFIDVNSISFPNNSYNVGINSTIQITPSYSPENATNKSFIFTSSDSGIASVDGNGVVFGKKEGSVVITVTSFKGNVDGSITVNVKNILPESVLLNNTNLVVKKNDTITLKASVKPDNASDKTITYSSSDQNIAKIDQHGIITGIKEGVVTVTAKTVNGKSSTCLVTVK